MRAVLALTAACVPAFLIACSSSSPTSVATGDAGANAGSTITFSMKHTVPASTETFQCMYVQPSVDRTFFTKIAHTFTPGSHHLVLIPTDLTAVPAGDDQPHDCYANGADFMTHARGFMYGSQIATDSFDLPKGVGFFNDPGAVYLLQTHYVNAGATELESTVSVTLTVSDGGDVTTKAGTFFFYDGNVHVPTGATASAGQRCPIPQDVTLIRVIPHTHARGTTFSAFLDPASGAPAAQPFYTSTDWEHPAPSPPSMALPGGSHVRFRCDYDNAKGTQDYFQGTSAIKNEMCVFGGVYYPDMGLLVNGCSQPDQFGVGTATCLDTAKCVDACYSPQLTDATAVDHCAQACLVKSCASAGPTLAAAATCAQKTCSDSCKVAGSGCLDCIKTKCPTEFAQCQSATCP